MLCQSIVPILMGMARAVGRSSDEEMPLISYLLSVHRDLRAETQEDARSRAAPRRRSFNPFRPILPRTMSTLVLSQSDLPSPSSTSPSVHLDAPDFAPRERSPSPLEAWGHGGGGGVVGAAAAEEVDDPADLHFNKVRGGVVCCVALCFNKVRGVCVCACVFFFEAF